LHRLAIKARGCTATKKKKREGNNRGKKKRQRERGKTREEMKSRIQTQGRK
jgi:hypothetical protein